MMSTPLAMLSLSGEYWRRFSDANDAGRMLAYRPSSLRSLRMPCSGRTAPVPHLGPPTAPVRQWAWRLGKQVPAQTRRTLSNSPKRTASDSWHALRVSSGRGLPWLSMAAPPKSLVVSSSWRPVFFEMRSRTRMACSVISGPGVSASRQVDGATKLPTDAVARENGDLETGVSAVSGGRCVRLGHFARGEGYGAEMQVERDVKYEQLRSSCQSQSDLLSVTDEPGGALSVGSSGPTNLRGVIGYPTRNC